MLSTYVCWLLFAVWLTFLRENNPCEVLYDSPNNPLIPSNAFPTFILSQRLESRLNFPELKSKMINTNDHWAWSICRPKWMFVYTCETILHSQNPQLEWGTKLGLKIPKKKRVQKEQKGYYIDRCPGWDLAHPFQWYQHIWWNMSTMCKDFHWKILECV